MAFENDCLSQDFRSIRLPSGSCMPTIGLGTYSSNADDRPISYEVVKAAIDAGYRHIDAAYMYKNEDFIGRAINEKIKEGIKREDLFITSKLWHCYHQPRDVKPVFMESLKLLGLDYLDLYLIHWPFATKKSSDPGQLEEKDKDGCPVYDQVPLEETWRAMEELVDAGLCKSIGVSNFNQSQIERILKIAKHPVSNLQIECNPYFTQNQLINFCRKHQISVTAYSPLYRKSSNSACASDPPGILTHPIITGLAEKYNKSGANIVLRFQVQRGVIAIPKSFTPSRIKENIQIYDFHLTEDEMKSIEGMNLDFRNLGRGKWIDNFRAHPEFPF